MHTTTQAAPTPTDALRTAMQRAWNISADCSPEEHAAHLLMCALEPLTDRDDDASITLPAVALQSVLEGLVNTLYGQRVAMQSVCGVINTALRATPAEVQP